MTAPFPILSFMEGYDVRPPGRHSDPLDVVDYHHTSPGYFYLLAQALAQASETTARKLRDRLYDHLQYLPYSYHKQADTGDLIQRCTSDGNNPEILRGAVREVGNALFMVTFSAYVMLSLDKRDPDLVVP